MQQQQFPLTPRCNKLLEIGKFATGLVTPFPRAIQAKDLPSVITNKR